MNRQLLEEAQHRFEEKLVYSLNEKKVKASQVPELVHSFNNSSDDEVDDSPPSKIGYFFQKKYRDGSAAAVEHHQKMIEHHQKMIDSGVGRASLHAQAIEAHEKAKNMHGKIARGELSPKGTNVPTRGIEGFYQHNNHSKIAFEKSEDADRASETANKLK